MTVQCPWCEYEGMISSVEAHISGKQDEAHRGKVGHDLKEHLPQTEEGQETSKETSEASSFATLAEEDQETSKGTSGEVSFGELPDSEESLEDGGESTKELPESGSDSSLPPGWALVGATALFAVAILLMTSDFGSSSTEIEADDDEEEEESTADEIPLIGGRA